MRLIIRGFNMDEDEYIALSNTWVSICRNTDLIKLTSGYISHKISLLYYILEGLDTTLHLKDGSYKVQYKL